MSKKRGRITNPEPFTPFESDSVSSRKRRSKPPKNHQLQHELIPSDVSSKILKQANLQKEEILKEERGAMNNNNNDNSNVFPALHNLKDNYDDDEDDDIDDFKGFSENHGQSGEFDFEDEIEEAEKLLEEALFSKEIIVEEIKDVQVSSGVQSVAKLDTSIIELYKGVGKLLNKYTAGKMPKAFKHIPSLQCWEQVLFLTEPEKWSPNAMFQATRIFASNMGVKKVERFYKLVLLPRVREDIRKNKRLHFALYQSLKKALYKPAAFNKGILFPLCECCIVEARNDGLLWHNKSWPSIHIMTISACMFCSYFIKLLIEKKYALPYRVLDALVAHFMKFNADSGVMPVIWHQSLLAFAQRLVSFSHLFLPLHFYFGADFMSVGISLRVENIDTDTQSWVKVDDGSMAGLTY
ncbi:hypothetical protein RD792_007214 [Penstemon davidsonii]|uniref:Bystin n=1 Tax=Penstemon davidsonii TaxID=160366 RepID=A0ABR0D5W7_9LAMI|nr:hypothetical protein RD792_007214 [Penstemon davidsonii]